MNYLRLADYFVGRLNGLPLPRGFSSSREIFSAALRLLQPKFGSAAIDYG